MKKTGFKGGYLIYLSLLIIVAAAVIIYVNMLLRRYEDFRPEMRVQEAVDMLVADALQENFWEKYSLQEMEPGSFEKHLDVQKEYLSLYADEEITFSQKSIAHEEDELYYIVRNNEVELAEIKLKAVGPAVTKLAVLSIREWKIEHIKPVLDAVDYTISVPVDFCVKANGIELSSEDGVPNGECEMTYTVEGLYLKPDLDITDHEGNVVSYTIDNGQVIAEFYNYILTLPVALSVEMNGEKCDGEVVEDNYVRYEIRTLEKPLINISDYYGNVVCYEGEAELPLTYMAINADSRYHVEVAGNEVPEEAITTTGNPEFEALADYVENLPGINRYDIAILEKDAEVTVTDEMGQAVSFEKGKTSYDFTSQRNALETVPDTVSAELDVLGVAQKWSLFMSNDIAFSQIKHNFIADSYQYKVALQYATGEDITFTSEHALMNPAFTENSVSNFVWITEDSFAVDVSFVKHMVLRVGTKVDDSMNDRFYFVKYDDTDDQIDNPAWKIVSMKEIGDNEK